MVKHIQAERGKKRRMHKVREEKEQGSQGETLRERMSGLFIKLKIKGMTKLALCPAHSQRTSKLTPSLKKEN